MKLPTTVLLVRVELNVKEYDVFRKKDDVTPRQQAVTLIFTIRKRRVAPVAYQN